MNAKHSIAALGAVVAVAVGSVALAQTEDKSIPDPATRAITSTPGAGHTATCNTLRGGTGQHRADPNACRDRVAPQAAVVAPPVEPVAVAPQPMPERVAEAPARTEMGAPPPAEPAAQPAPMRPARRDRG